MMQSRTHNCNQLRIENVGEKVKLVGWMENVREVGGNLAFVVLRDFYGTTQVVVEDEADLKVIKGINKESTISVEGTVRERASKNSKQATGEIEVVPEKIEVLGRCRYNSLPFEINRSREADETQRLKYRYLDLRNPAVKKNIILRCQVIAALRQAMMAHDFLEITTPILTASSLQINEFRGSRSLQLQLVDLRSAHDPGAREAEQLELCRTLIRGGGVSAKDAAKLLPSREQFVRVWRALEREVDGTLTSPELPFLRRLSAEALGAESFPRTVMCLAVFAERGLVTVERHDKYITLRLTGGKRVDLDASPYLGALREGLDGTTGGSSV